MLVFGDRVKETSTTLGTGTLDLAGPTLGFQSFVSAIGDGNECFYTIVDTVSGSWEVGRGTVTDAATDTLSRDSVIDSSNAGSLVSFAAGTKEVFVTAPAPVVAEIKALVVTEHSSSTTLTEAESGSINTNRTAAGVVTLTLPVTTSLVVGTHYYFRRIVSFAFRVDPQAGDNLRYSVGAMAAGEYLEMASNEAMFRVTWDGSEWLVDQENGTLVEETP